MPCPRAAWLVGAVACQGQRPDRAQVAGEGSGEHAVVAARCQACSRRQQVIPEPIPSSAGSFFHGTPVSRTDRMPSSTARSSIRGRPVRPLAAGAGSGISGSASSHN